MNLSYPSHSSHFSLFQPAGVSTRILLADDNRTLYRSLVRAGYQVTHAATDTAIWKHLEAHDIELVILNLTMPGVNGLEICQQIRQRSDIPIILLTPNHAETIISGLEVGADDAIWNWLRGCRPCCALCAESMGAVDFIIVMKRRQCNPSSNTSLPFCQEI
jgi:CheY-like chemotaxis protein